MRSRSVPISLLIALGRAHTMQPPQPGQSRHSFPLSAADMQAPRPLMRALMASGVVLSYRYYEETLFVDVPTPAVPTTEATQEG